MCELLVQPSHGYGEQGRAALGVPPGATLRLTVAVLDWVAVEDVSEAKDGAALKRVLRRGEGGERPLELTLTLILTPTLTLTLTLTLARLGAAAGGLRVHDRLRAARRGGRGAGLA